MNGGFMSLLFKKHADEEESCEIKFGHGCVIFKYQELKKATNSFSIELGRGAYGRVYLGKLGDGRIVAVKVLGHQNPKRLEQFFNEATVLSRARHKNLIRLYGCSSPASQKLLLVYEYVPNGTVAEHLHGQQSAPNWAARIRIAVETAEALAYLNGLEPPIIHRDVKTSNILLDHAFHAIVADLGICRPLPWDTAHVSTPPQGTMGYRDPEYDIYCRLSDKTDVYSFGVVLMEIISGQQAVDVTREEIYLCDMALSKIMNDKLEEFVDPRLGYHSNNDIRRVINSVAQLAAQCLHPTGNTRPSMVQVVADLKEIQNEMKQLGLNDGAFTRAKSKAKIVVRVAMEDAEQRTKAMRITVGMPGVISATLEVEKIVVVGDGLDPVKLAVKLKKRMGFAELVSVPIQTQQKIVVRVTMEDAKQFIKAMKIAMGMPGVISATPVEERIVVVGNGLDVDKLAVKLKKMGFAELVSVGAAEEKKQEVKKEEKKADEAKSLQPALAYDNYYEPSCSIM